MRLGGWEEERAHAERQSRLKVQSQTVGVAVKEAPWNLGQQSGTIAGKISRSCAAVGHSGGGLYRHGDYVMSARAICRGDEADTARIVLAGGVERRCCGSSGVSSLMLAGTGRVDPLPIGGHGVSKVVAPESGEAHMGHKKGPLRLGAGRGSASTR